MVPLQTMKTITKTEVMKSYHGFFFTETRSHVAELYLELLILLPPAHLY